MEKLYCQGCGIMIQTENQTELGYAPKSALDRDPILCQRCFRLKHYNQVQSVAISDEEFLDLISQIGEASGLVVHLVDIFDVSGSLIKSLPRLVGHNPIILVGNKLDLLPKSTNQRKLKQWLRSSAKSMGIDVKDVFLISSAKGHGIDELAEAIDDYRAQKDVYVVGTTNVGKSTFINRLIKRSTGENNVITTSYFPGTTLGFIEIPLDETTALIDTPGIVNKQQMVHYVSDHDLKLITPNKEIKPRVYQLNSEQTLFFGGLARLDFVKGEKQSFVCYFANALPIHRTKTANADELYRNHKGKLLSPPDQETLSQLPAFTEATFRLTEEKTDIVFPGLGWVTINRPGTTVRAYNPKGVSASLRKALI
ncbi:ribosome biogenesis GTPase YqeH [Lentibacillus daqui]|uniref:ribosome biogenesis GTPase YqeH n=1 Tax=Lentibacillus daqui TaxID=2911514 RepID=UPI0022B213C7|nr:ribosome biogenesis GTPase YqeH [Lentibacillus daqui]